MSLQDMSTLRGLAAMHVTSSNATKELSGNALYATEWICTEVAMTLSAYKSGGCAAHTAPIFVTVCPQLHVRLARQAWTSCISCYRTQPRDRDDCGLTFWTRLLGIALSSNFHIFACMTCSIIHPADGPKSLEISYQCNRADYCDCFRPSFAGMWCLCTCRLQRRNWLSSGRGR